MLSQNKKFLVAQQYKVSKLTLLSQNRKTRVCHRTRIYFPEECFPAMNKISVSVDSLLLKTVQIPMSK